MLATLYRPKLLAWPLLLGCATLLACSAILNFNPAGLACDVAQQEACLNGYSCNIPNPNQYICIADHSLNAGDICQLDRQCANGLICPTGVGQCVQPCPLTDSYVPTTASSCADGSYCLPVFSIAMFSDGLSHTAQQVAACVASDNCSAGAQCSNTRVQGGLCAPLGSATACLTSCEISFTAGVYHDNCGDNAMGIPRYCQPVGTGIGNYVLACLDIGSKPLANGASCSNPVATPCSSGAACINQVCVAYCDVSLAAAVACSSNQMQCDLQINATQLLGYCSDNC